MAMGGVALGLSYAESLSNNPSTNGRLRDVHSSGFREWRLPR